MIKRILSEYKTIKILEQLNSIDINHQYKHKLIFKLLKTVMLLLKYSDIKISENNNITVIYRYKPLIFRSLNIQFKTVILKDLNVKISITIRYKNIIFEYSDNITVKDTDYNIYTYVYNRL